MYSKAIFGLTALAAGSAAFMIPPDADAAFNIASEPLKSPLQTFGVDPYSSVVKVPCDGPSGPCPLAQFSEKGVSWIKDQENYLAVKISVSADSKSLEWNGVPFYPPQGMLGNQLPEVFQVPGTVEEPENNVRVARPARALKATSWSVRAKTMHTSPESQEEIIDLHLSIHAVEQKSILIHDIVIGVVKDQKDDLLILASGVSKEQPMKLCQKMPMLCQLRGIVADKVSAMKHKFGGGCHRHHGFGKLDHKHPHRPHHRVHHNRPHHKVHHEHPHHHTTHHYHHHQKMHGFHGFMDKVARVLLNVVIPILLGVLAGMVTYLIGLTVGTGLALAWIKFRRYRRGEYTPVSLDDNDDSNDEEKAQYADEKEHVEAPPVYVEVEANEAGQK